tara:strand:+ start:1065 stop:1658 length:594 start_codon:yes stop_codon:yes gene_type:complete
MHFIITALKSEAKPIIDFYGLEFSGLSNFPLYKNNNITLIVTGVGRKNVSNVLNLFFQKNKVIKNHIINIGISGGRKDDCSIGQLFLINKVSDEKSKLSFSLGPQQSFGLQNNEITTVSKPVVNNNFKGKGLVDMEAYEICTAINNLDGLDRLFILKIVSDNMDMKNHISTNQVRSLIKQKIPVIDKFINDLRKLKN